MGDAFVCATPGRPKPLAALPRGRPKDVDGIKPEPVAEIDVEFGRNSAGCCVCNKPITPQTTRVMIRVWLREPINGRRTEKYYMHPGCLTERVRPEVIRSRMDCYDCGAIPEQKTGGHIYWHYRCFTVSKFAAAPLCGGCIKKPRWKRCDACDVYFPHWMVSEVSGVREVPAAHLSQYADLRISPQDNLCGYCSNRLAIPTVLQTEEARSGFERLRQEILDRGVFEAGDDG